MELYALKVKIDENTPLQILSNFADELVERGSYLLPDPLEALSVGYKASGDFFGYFLQAVESLPARTRFHTLKDFHLWQDTFQLQLRRLAAQLGFEILDAWKKAFRPGESVLKELDRILDEVLEEL